MSIEDNICLICYNELTAILKCTLHDCGHLFCKECLFNHILTSHKQNNIKNNLLCPLDRRVIKSVEYYDSISEFITTKSIRFFANDYFLEWYQEERKELIEVINIIFSSLYKGKGLYEELNEKMKIFDNTFNKGSRKEVLEVMSSIIDEENGIVRKIFNCSSEFDLIDRMSIVKDFEINIINCHKYLNFFGKKGKVNNVINTIFITINIICQIKFLICNCKNIIQINLEFLIMSFHQMKKKILEEKPVDNKYYKARQSLLKQNHKIILRYAMWIKASILQLPEITRFSKYYINSVEFCILCEESIKNKRQITFEGCAHYICGVCAERFMIVRPKCIFGCSPRSMISIQKSSIDKETENYKEDKEKFIFLINSLLNCITDTLYKIINELKILDLKTIMGSLCSVINNTIEFEDLFTTSVKTIFSFYFSLCHIYQIVSAEIKEIQYKTLGIILKQKKLIEEYGDPFVFIRVYNILKTYTESLENCLMKFNCPPKKFTSEILEGVYRDFHTRSEKTETRLYIIYKNLESIKRPEFQTNILNLGKALEEMEKEYQ